MLEFSTFILSGCAARGYLFTISANARANCIASDSVPQGQSETRRFNPQWQTTIIEAASPSVDDNTVCSLPDAGIDDSADIRTSESSRSNAFRDSYLAFAPLSISNEPYPTITATIGLSQMGISNGGSVMMSPRTAHPETDTQPHSVTVRAQVRPLIQTKRFFIMQHPVAESHVQDSIAHKIVLCRCQNCRSMDV